MSKCMIAIGSIATLFLTALVLAAPAPQEPRELAVLKGHSIDGVLWLAFSPDGKLLASAGRGDHAVKLWDVASGKCLTTLEGHTDFVEVVAFSPDGKTVASGGQDQTVRLWDAATGKQLAALPDVDRSTVNDVAFSPDGKTLASASSGGSVTLWDLGTNRESKTVRVGESGLRQRPLAFTQRGTLVAVAHRGGELGVLTVRDVTADKELSHFQAARNGGLTCAAFNPDRSTLATAVDDTVTLWEVNSGKEKRAFRYERPVERIHSLAFSPDGKTLAVGSQGRLGDNVRVHLMDLATGREFATFKPHDKSIFCLLFSPDGRALASASVDTTIKLWSVPTR